MIYWGSELIIGKQGRTHAPTFHSLSYKDDDGSEEDVVQLLNEYFQQELSFSYLKEDKLLSNI